MGAELSVSVPILEAMFIHKKPISFIFKDFKSDFLKRADTSVIFEFSNVNLCRQTIDQAVMTGERINQTFNGIAYSAEDSENIFMKFEITTSIKKTK